MKSFFIGAFAAIAACAIFFGALYGWHRLTRPEEYADETEVAAANTSGTADSTASTTTSSSNNTNASANSADYRQGYDDGYQAALNGAGSGTQTSGTGSVSSGDAAQPAEDLTLYNETVMSEHRTPKNPAYGQTLSYAEAWSPYGDGTLASEGSGTDAAALSAGGTSADGVLAGDGYGTDGASGINDQIGTDTSVITAPAAPAEEWIPVPAPGIP